MKSLYDILEVPKDANTVEIKKAYKTLSMKYHPDRETGDEEKFKAIKEAYEVLSDSERKAKYDATGATGNRQIDYTTKLFQLFEAAISRANDLATTDVLAICNDLVDSTISEGERQKAQFNKEVARIEVFLERLSSKNDNTIIHDLYRNKLSSLQQHISIIEEEIAYQKVIKEKLKDFDYSYTKTAREDNMYTATTWVENWGIK